MDSPVRSWQPAIHSQCHLFLSAIPGRRYATNAVFLAVFRGSFLQARRLFLQPASLIGVQHHYPVHRFPEMSVMAKCHRRPAFSDSAAAHARGGRANRRFDAILLSTPNTNHAVSQFRKLASLESADTYLPISEDEYESPTALNSTTSFSQLLIKPCRIVSSSNVERGMSVVHRYVD